MPFSAKIAIFFAVMWGTLWLMLRFPHHPVSRIALSWHGPLPTNGERLSRFLARQAVYALKWFLQVLTVLCAMWVLAGLDPAIGYTTGFLVFWGALSLLGGTFLLAAIVYGARSFKRTRFGPDPTFEFEDDRVEA